MKYYKKFNSVDKFNNWYLKNNYVEPNIIVIKEYNDHGEEISTTVDYNNEMLTLVYDTSSDKGTHSLWTTYNEEIYDMIYIDNQLVKNTMNPILSSNLSKGKHVVKIKFKNKNIIGNNAPIIYNPYLIKANIPNSVTTIGNNAFNGCSSLTEINIPDSVTTIDNNAFNGCSSLTDINIPDSVTTIGANVFIGCPLETINLNVNNIQSMNYYGILKTALKHVTLGNNVTTIDNGAFNECSLLTDINIPDSVTSIGYNAFYGCTSLTDINIPDSITTISSGSFSGCTSLTEINIPDSVTTIGDGAFSGCSSLTEINIPNSVTSIGSYAFSGCSSLTEINIPDSVTAIGSATFGGCAFKKITFGVGLTNLSSLTNYGINSSNLEECNILSNITELPSGMFVNYYKLTKVTLPNTLTTIGGGAFYECTSLESLTIPDSVTTIGSDAFNGCTSLESLTIPDSVTTIGSDAFNGCTSLSNINIPDSVTTIGYSVFDRCTQLFNIIDNIYYFDVNNNFGSFVTGISDTTLTSYAIKEGTVRIDAVIPNLPNAVLFTLPSTLEEIKNYSLDNVANILTKQQIELAININNNSICYSKLLKYYYTKEQISNEYFTIYNTSNFYIGIKWIQNGTGENSDIMKYSIDNGVTWNEMINNTNYFILPNNKFIFKSTLSPSYLEGIGTFTFSTSSDKFNVSGNIMSLLYGDNFRNQTSLEGKDYAFYNLFDIDVVDASYLILPATTLSEGCYSNMFNGCTSLTSAPALPATTLADNCYYKMFYECTSLTSAPLLPATTLAESCYDSMFYGCTNLTSAPALPATTLIDYCYEEMFYGCTSLTTAPVLPATTLAENCYSNMFYECTSLTSAPALPATTLAVNCYSYMFEGCTSLTAAPELPATTLAECCYMSMFTDCTSLTSAPALPATTLVDECYEDMFNGCTSLTTAPVLSATILADYCYQYMFADCTSLTTAPALPATTLAESCYEEMFKGCTSLTTAPALSATVLASYCYAGMFYECTSLTTAPALSTTTLSTFCYSNMFNGCTGLTSAPALPATTLVNYCYNYMFYNCSSLNYIKALFTTTPSTSYTDNWVDGVASTGTFIKSQNATWNVRGIHGVPSGWSIQEYEIRPEPRELPEGYTEVKYIASTKTGGQYIDLNILLYDVLNKNYDIAMKFNIIGNGSDNDSQPTIFGCQDNTADPWPGTFIRRSASNVVGRYIGGSAKDNTLGQLGNIIELTEKTSPSKNVYNYNNSGKVHSWGTSLFCAFANANGTPMRQCEARIYYFKLFVEGILVRDLVPCINSSNVPGFYDVVNDTFYTSLSNTPFIYEAYLS